MSPYSQHDKFHSILIFFTAVILCFINLGGHPIYILDEAKNAEAAREMFVNNDWLVPTFNGELRTDKPPLHYWFMMISYKIFGVSAFSARFFSAVFGVLTILSTFHYTKKFLNRKIALLTTFILCSSIFFMQEFHLAVPDPYLIFFVSFALFKFYDFYLNNKLVDGFAFYFALGLGTLAKGPVAIALPGLIALVFLLAKRDFNWRTLKRLNPLLGGILVLAVSVPWYILVHKRTDGAFTQGFFIDHNINRFGSEMEGHGGLPFVTWAFVLLGLLPFSFYIVQGFIHSWKTRKTNDFILFSFIVSAVFVVFFSISNTKLPNYPMPSYPFMGVLIAIYLGLILDRTIAIKSYKISLWLILIITLAMPIAGYIALAMVETQLFDARFSSVCLAILSIGSILSMIFLKRKQLSKSIIALGICSMLLTITMFQFVYPTLTDESPLVKAKEIMNTDTETILYKGYDPAFLFNFEREFPYATTKAEVMEFLNKYPEALVITKDKFHASDWNENETEVLLEQKALFENYTIVIFKLK